MAKTDEMTDTQIANGVARLGECEKCDGRGEYDTPHAMWGSPSCPEAYINVRCSECDGSGVVEIELEDAA